MSNRGHNENAVRLSMLADEAKQGLERVTQGEENSIGGWLAVGFALNEARAIFRGDREFGEWVALCQLDTADRHDRAAAMWAAANADQFEEARQRGNPRTIRGIHAKWKEIEAEREKAAHDEAMRIRAEEDRKAATERAEAAKAEAEKKAAVEAEAKQALETASDDAERQEAEARAAEAAQEREKAEQEATEAVASIPADDPEPEPEPDPYGYAKLTDEALLDLANGLRADLDDETAKRKAAEAEAKALKAQLRDFEGNDKDAVIRRLQASVKNAENAKWKALEDRDAFNRQLYAVKKERDAALKGASK
ncbi:MAG: hypothetical protein GOVbin2937_59 [Prokaryotic dsDNA virus sp.]|nr:MAG: hypothetical protein GOVbin2937_59 [Prokaryotic dsDNA virus sp.]|tara:strand:- start:12962 stop:13888 length:927 start_codon:yes stop_codon:yes gene_type:complete